MKIAIIKIRGTIGSDSKVKSTMQMLGLKKKNNCAIIEDSPQLQGMLRKVESLITWGPVDEATLKEMKKKGEKIIKLNNPKKGFGRKGIKMPFKLGGAYGNRAEKINDLLTRMQ